MSQNRVVRTFLLVAALLLGLLQEGLRAEETSKSADAVEIEDTVVVASPVIEGNTVNQYGSQVTTVTEQQIQDLNAQDLPSALRRVPGVIISRHNPIGSFGGGDGGAVFIRGQGSSRPGAEIQMSLDGIPRFVGVWTHPLMDVNSIDPVERIEVYKGAQPVLFGNMAFGAVNMVTKRVRDPGLTGRVQGAYGSYDTWVGIAELGSKSGAFDYYGNVSYRESDGHRDNADGEIFSCFGRAGYEISSHWDANVLFSGTDSWANDPGPEDGSHPPDGRFAVDDFITIFTAANRYAWGNGTLKAYWNRGDLDWTGQFNETTGQNDSDTLTDYDNYGVRVRQFVNPWNHGELMMGFDADFISGKAQFVEPPGEPQFFDRETFRILSPYVSLSHQLGEKTGWHVIPSAGARYFNHSEFEDEWGPQFGLVVGYRTTTVHAYYGRGLNYPGINVVIFDEVFIPGPDLKWRDLQPEVLDHVEVGICHDFMGMLQVDVTWFYNDGKDRYVLVPPPPPPPVFSSIDSYRTQGVETTVTAILHPNLSLFGGFTYLDKDPSDLPYAPTWSASGGLNFCFLEHFELSVDALFVDDYFTGSRDRSKGFENQERIDSFFLLNGKLAYSFPLPWKDMTGQVYVAGENLTDTDYEYKQGYPMPGINGMGGLVLEF
jgi:outer membrane cobalamin receptor